MCSEGNSREPVASSKVEAGSAVGVEVKARRSKASQIKVSLIPPLCSHSESASKENQTLQVSAGEDLGSNCGAELKHQGWFSILNLSRYFITFSSRFGPDEWQVAFFSKHNIT